MSRDDLNDLRRRAFIAVEAANHELAISLFREALDICESKEEASVLLTNISLLYHEDKDWDQALDCAEKVCTQCPLPDDDIGVDNLPKNCQALQSWPGNVKACFRKGAAQMKLGSPAAACASFLIGLQVIPGNRHLLSALGEAQAQVRQEFRVVAHADSLRHQHPVVTAAEVSEWAGTCLKVSVWMEGTLGAEYERQSAEVARRWKNSGWLHQNSLREKGWYDSYQQKHVATPQAVMDASVEMELHKILQLTPGATLSDVRAAYKRMVLAAHPDKGGSMEAFDRVQQAYNVLSAQCLH